MRTILFYENPNGQKPVELFLDSLASKPAQKVVWVLQLIEEIDHVPAQYFKKLVNTDGIWEVRFQFGGNIYRLLGFFEDENFLILTSGFTKKKQ
jgi:hypothetical protein